MKVDFAKLGKIFRFIICSDVASCDRFWHRIVSEELLNNKRADWEDRAEFWEREREVD